MRSVSEPGFCLDPVFGEMKFDINLWDAQRKFAFELLGEVSVGVEDPSEHGVSDQQRVLFQKIQQSERTVWQRSRKPIVEYYDQLAFACTPDFSFPVGWKTGNTIWDYVQFSDLVISDQPNRFYLTFYGTNDWFDDHMYAVDFDGLRAVGARPL